MLLAVATVLVIQVCDNNIGVAGQHLRAISVGDRGRLGASDAGNVLHLADVYLCDDL